jgi:hypothetical protein
MLCVSLQRLTRACGSVSGGISDIAFFDPYDFDFTNTTVNGVAGAYTAIARRTAGTGAAGTAVLSTNTVGSVNITNGGSGYVVAPAVTFTGGGGSGAAGTATIVNGVVVSVTVTSPGTGYTSAPTIAFNATTNTGKIYPVSFQQDEAEWKWSQSVKGCSVKYDHEFDFQIPDNSQTMTNWQQSLDAAACCCGLGMIVRLNNGKILVAGEKFVNGTEQPRFTLKQDGSSGTSGKLIDDANAGNMVFKGSYTRNLYEYSGDWADITALTL